MGIEPLMNIELPLPKIHSGKVREIFDTNAYMLGTRLIVSTDRISVKDRPLQTGIENKGRILNGISATMFRTMEINNICPTHLIADTMYGLPPRLMSVLEDYIVQLDWRFMLVREAMVLPYEFIPRSCLLGTAFEDYIASGRKSVFGIPMPSDLEEGDSLPTTLFTLSTKASAGQHDENLAYSEFVGQVGAATAQKVYGMCLSIYSMMQIFAVEHGFKYADTKIELGWMLLPGAGYVLGVVDELGTPDSSRTIPSGMTKQPVRDYLKTQGFTGDESAALPKDVVEQTSRNYGIMYKKVTGKVIA